MHLVKMLFSKRHIFSSFLSMANTPKEIVLKGIPASPGICHGNATLFTQINIDIPLYTISPDQIQKEKERFEKAIISTREEILLIRNKVSKSLGEDEALIKEKTEALSTTMMKLGEAAYTGDSDDKDGDPTSEKNLNENSDEVVDADFEEIDDSDKDNEEDMKKAN